MKPKHLNKKLTLNKQSISDLSRPEMHHVKGGFDPLPTSTYTCIFCDSNASCTQGPALCFQYAGPTSDCFTVHPEDNCVSNAYTYCICF